MNPIEGWLTRPQRKVLFEMGGRHARIVELGAYKGLSASVFARGQAAANVKGRSIVCVDCFRYTGWGHEEDLEGSFLDEFVANVREWPWIEWQVVDHADQDRIVAEVGRADLVYVDGDHSYEACRRDIETARRLGARTIVCHDFRRSCRGVLRACKEAGDGHPHRGFYIIER